MCPQPRSVAIQCPQEGSPLAPRLLEETRKEILDGHPVPACHAQLSTTLEHYTRIMPDALRSARARLPFGNVFGVVPKSYREQDEEENAGRRTDQEFA